MPRVPIPRCRRLRARHCGSRMAVKRLLKDEFWQCRQAHQGRARSRSGLGPQPESLHRSRWVLRPSSSSSSLYFVRNVRVLGESFRDLCGLGAGADVVADGHRRTTMGILEIPEASAAVIKQSRREPLIASPVSRPAPTCRHGGSNPTTLTAHEPSRTPLTGPEIDNRLRRTFEALLPMLLHYCGPQYRHILSQHFGMAKPLTSFDSAISATTVPPGS